MIHNLLLLGRRRLVMIAVPLIISVNNFNQQQISHCEHPDINQTPTFTYADTIIIKPKVQKKSTSIVIHDILHNTATNAWLLLHRLYRILLRTLFISIVYTPPLLLSPLLLHKDFSDAWWEIFRSAVRDSGPCLTKLAQWVATRPDVFPLSLCLRLQDLQSAHISASYSLNKARQLLDREFIDKNWSGDISLCSVKSIKTGIDETVTLGSGCVAQVILAERLADGKPLAVKMVHPSVRQAIEADMTIVRTAVTLLEAILPGFTAFSLSESVEEFSVLLNQQLDMRVEADNLVKFRANFGSPSSLSSLPKSSSVSQSPRNTPSSFSNDTTAISSTGLFTFRSLFTRLTDTLLHFIWPAPSAQCISFPEPFPTWCTENVLIESYEHGPLISELILACDISTRKNLAELGLHAILKMVFEDNFVHADLHPGNIICQSLPPREPPKGFTSLLYNFRDWMRGTTIERATQNENMKQFRLVLIDAGLTAQLEPEDRRNFVAVFHAIITNDGSRVGQLMIERSARHECHDPDGFNATMQEIVNEVHANGLSLKHVSVAQLMQKLLVACYQHQVKLEARFVALILALGILEGLGRRLDPDVDILQRAAPYILRAAVRDVTDAVAASHLTPAYKSITTDRF